MTNPPTILFYRNRRWEAYNEDGRLVAHDVNPRYLMAGVMEIGYRVVPRLSRIGATIEDKVKGKLYAR